jgi:hypothetical protein
MSQVSQVEARSKAASHSSKDGAITQAAEERFTPLLTRDAHTQMRSDSRGPRMFSALCCPGWKQG